MLTTCTLFYSRSLELFFSLPVWNTCCFQLLSCVRLLMTSWAAAPQASLSFTIARSLLKFMPIESVIPFNHLIHFLLLFLPLIFPSIGGFSNKLALCTRWPNHWSFSFNISPSNKYSGLISFRIDWFDLLALPGALKSLSPKLQFKNVNFSVLSLLYSPILTAIHDYWKRP